MNRDVSPRCSYSDTFFVFGWSSSLTTVNALPATVYYSVAPFLSQSPSSGRELRRPSGAWKTRLLQDHEQMQRTGDMHARSAVGCMRRLGRSHKLHTYFAEAIITLSAKYFIRGISRLIIFSALVVGMYLCCRSYLSDECTRAFRISFTLLARFPAT